MSQIFEIKSRLHFTTAGEQGGQLAASLQAESTPDLQKAYLGEVQSPHWANPVFGGNARRWMCHLGAELIRRGITAIQVRDFLEPERSRSAREAANHLSFATVKTDTITPEQLAASYARLFPAENLPLNADTYRIFGNWLERFRADPIDALATQNWCGNVTHLATLVRLAAPRNRPSSPSRSRPSKSPSSPCSSRPTAISARTTRMRVPPQRDSPPRSWSASVAHFSTSN
jgi:hypothetical protein